MPLFQSFVVRENMKTPICFSAFPSIRRIPLQPRPIRCRVSHVRIDPSPDVRASVRMKTLIEEFESLTEPVDRVKRLLDYAQRLHPLEEQARCSCSRVHGCTTQVWLHVGLDNNGRVRFRADSDSEITKGFISCLVWMLDGAEPEEVAIVRPDDLEAVNVGLHVGRAHSRVNTWQNILLSMQNRTRSLLHGGNGFFCYCRDGDNGRSTTWIKEKHVVRVLD